MNAIQVSPKEQIKYFVEGYLNNFECVTTKSSLDLTGDVGLFQLSLEETKRLQSSPSVFHTGGFSATWKLGIDVVGESLQDVQKKADQKLEEVLSAFRLLKAGGVEARVLHYVSCNPGNSRRFDDFNLIGALGTYREGSYSLGEDDIPRVKRLLTLLTVSRNSKVRISLHRFNVAYFDYRDDDKLIDNVIALEALLLPESQELGLRLAIRAACLLGTLEERQVVYEFVREAYKWRSELVHGGKHGLAEVIESGGIKYSGHDFVVKLQNFVRHTLRLCLERPSSFSKEQLETLSPFVSKFGEKSS